MVRRTTARMKEEDRRPRDGGVSFVTVVARNIVLLERSSTTVRRMRAAFRVRCGKGSGVERNSYLPIWLAGFASVQGYGLAVLR